MLKPALLYKEELKRKEIEQWYNPRSLWYSCSFAWCRELATSNEEKLEFVSVNEENEAIGFLSFQWDWTARSAHSFGIISFEDDFEFVKDTYRLVDLIFNQYKANRMEWWCYDDNPTYKTYLNFVRKYGGRRVGHLDDGNVFRDGSRHSSTIFQILRKEFQFEKFGKSFERIEKRNKKLQ